MNQKALKTLEYNKIIMILTDKADSEPGKKLCRELVPYTNLDQIRSAQQETKDALARLFKVGSTSFGNNRDFGFSIKSLEIGSTLSASELLKLAGFLENVNRIKTYGKKDREDTPSDSLDSYFEQLTPLTQISNEILHCILQRKKLRMMPAPNSRASAVPKCIPTRKFTASLPPC